SATELFDPTEILVDQTIFCCPSTSFTFPSPAIVKLADWFVPTRGFSLLATQTGLIAGLSLYHIPTYRFSEPFGLKKPNSKTCPEDIRIWFTSNGSEEVIL